MALIKYSALVQEMRNKLNGSVLSKNRAGNYIRNKTTPTNPQTSYQQNQRALLSTVSQAWRGLSDSARAAFSQLAENHPYTNIFGDSVKLDGKSMFSKVSLNRLIAGQALPSDAVPFVEIPFVSVESVEAGVADGLAIGVNVETIPAGFSAILQATEPLPATIGFVKNKYRNLGVVVATDEEIDATSLYVNRFGALSAVNVGQKIHVRLFLISNTAGNSGIASEGVATVIS